MLFPLLVKAKVKAHGQSPGESRYELLAVSSHQSHREMQLILSTVSDNTCRLLPIREGQSSLTAQGFFWGWVSVSVIYVHTSILFQIFFPYKSSQNIDRVLCAIQKVPLANHSIYLSAHMPVPNPSQSLPLWPVPFGNHNFVFKVCELCSATKFNCILFLDSTY